VKLDTNGYRPEVLKALAEENLMDYVAMDIKNCPRRYAETAGLPGLDLKKIEESMTFLIQGTLPYEFRTTVTAQHHTPEDIASIGKWFQTLSQDTKVQKYFLQPYTDRDSVLCSGLSAPNPLQLKDFLTAIAPYVHTAEIRGFE
jgi:pyruvate formate lyase activating enzyme